MTIVEALGGLETAREAKNDAELAANLLRVQNQTALIEATEKYNAARGGNIMQTVTTEITLTEAEAAAALSGAGASQ